MPADLSDVRREMSDLVDESRRRIGDEAVAALEGPKSAWPVDTGRSKRSWIHRTVGAFVEVVNHAPYASFVEFRRNPFTYPYRPALVTLRANLQRIANRAAR